MPPSIHVDLNLDLDLDLDLDMNHGDPPGHPKNWDSTNSQI
jgi:hypothetical protein